MRLGVCSWSLQPDSPGQLAERVGACGLSGVQLALDPIRRGDWDEQQTLDTLNRHAVSILSGMMAMTGEDYSTLDTIKRTGGVRPDTTWPANLEAAKANAALAERLGLDLVTFHAGFLPHDQDTPERATLIERLRTLADVFAEHGVRVGFETGQESAATLLSVLDDIEHPNIGVNFDPANMILYAMGDPVESLRLLRDRVVQVHLKDADPTDSPGTWGRERPVGQGTVDWPAFFDVVRDGPDVDLLIEREQGGSRTHDVQAAADLARQHLDIAG